MHQFLMSDPDSGFLLRTNHVLLLLAVIVCCWHGARRLRRVEGMNWRRARWGFVILAVVPWVGGHLHFLINNWSFAAARPARLLLPWLGLHAGGVILSLAIATPVVVRYYGLPLGRIADALVPTLGLGIVIGRLGCFAEGCCFGRVCEWPWCITFPKGPYIYEFHLSRGLIPATATRSASVHPLELYFAAVGVVLCIFAYWLAPRKRYDGEVALIALIIFSVSSAFLEFFREDYSPRVYWGPLPQLEWTALAMTCLSLLAWVFATRRLRGGWQHSAEISRPPPVL